MLYRYTIRNMTPGIIWVYELSRTRKSIYFYLYTLKTLNVSPISASDNSYFPWLSMK